ncbi:PREDICTED: transmembrane protein 82 [Nanorana parkeri]|uniref:transmembrane protein 82 n=1 Tax=Nanorana parkeri TaxID=125878 RepID=UPI0008543ABD|nr:PREDICTED: transmembrane protein 82 [Nanorana parkeri]
MGLFSYMTSFLPGVPWHFWGSVDSLLQGVVGACAVSVLYNLMRVHLFIKCLNDPDRQDKAPRLGSQSRLRGLLHLVLLSVIYAFLGPRVGALVVLEFSLRAVSMILSMQKASQNSQLFLLCQFSLGCGITCSLDYLHEGAPHRTWNLLLAAGLSGLIVWQTRRMCRHVGEMYRLHSSERYCGVCLTLLACWRDMPAVLCRALKVAFLVSEEQHQHPTEQMALQTVCVRMGGLLILMMTVGRWADILHIVLSLIGEIWCLMFSGMMLQICREEDYGIGAPNSRRAPGPGEHKWPLKTEAHLDGRD